MKKIFFAVILLLVGSSFAFAQKPVAGDNQLTGLFNSVSGVNILLRHYKKDNFVLRYGLGFTYSYSNNTSVNNSEGYQTITKSSSTSFSGSIGLQKNIKTASDKIEPYFGVDIVISEQSSSSSIKEEILDSALYRGGFSNGDYTFQKTKNPTTFSAALRPLVGVNYYFNNNLGVGVEYRINSLVSGSYGSGGNSNFYYTQQHVINPQDESFTNTPHAFSYTSSFSGSLYVTVSYKFNKKNN